MRESMGKEMLQRIMHREILPRLFSREQIRHGSFLKLLGKRPRELEFLDEYGVPRSSIWSVERKQDVYNYQVTQRWGINAYCGEIKEVLEHMLGINLHFLWMDLDIQGSYLTHLDPAMTQVLGFCWRNPETLLTTYHSVGRDEETIWEGVKSFALFLYCAPKLATKVLLSLSLRYEQAGFSEPVLMSLRDMCWLRSILEHALAVSARTGEVEKRQLELFQRMSHAIWEECVKVRRMPLKFKHLQASIDALYDRRLHKDIVFINEPCMHVRLKTMFHLVYNAQWPWSQMCHTVRFGTNSEPATPGKWLEEALSRLMETPLVYISRDGRRYSLANEYGGGQGLTELVICADRRLYTRFNPRTLKFAHPHRPSASVRTEAEGPELKSTPPPARPGGADAKIQMKEDDVTKGKAPRLSARNFEKDGKLTEFGREFFRKLASEGFETADILVELPDPIATKYRQHVIAAVAVAHRDKKPSSKKAANRPKK